MKNRFWTILYAGWLATVVVLSLSPSPPQFSAGLLNWDKFQHAGAYALLTALGGLGLRPWVRAVGRCWPTSAATAVLVGILLEVAQGLMAIGRQAGWRDGLADAVGAGGVLLFVALGGLYRSRRPAS